MLIAGWKLLFFERSAFRPDPAQNAEWNRGAYLTAGLSHCGACHTPRNALGAEKRDLQFAGGEAEGWHAPALNASSRTPIPWTAESLFRYLRSGTEPSHHTAAGPMAPVVQNLGSVPEGEVRAIATYIASLMGAPNAERQQRAAQIAAATRKADDGTPEVQLQDGRKDSARMGATIYAGSCAMCHTAAELSPESSSGNALHLSLSTALVLPSPANLIRVILQGLAPPEGEAGAFMPPFQSALTDEQVVSLVTYLRATYTQAPEWRDVAREVRNARQALSSEQVSAKK
jgi:mono/diheme cytochrome c family protein